MSYEFKGLVIEVLSNSGNKKDNSGKWFSQTITVEQSSDSKYPDILVGEIFGEENIKKFNVCLHDEVKVYFSPKASQWKEKWYPKNSIYKVDKLSSASTTTTQAPVAQPSPTDDLPF